MALAGISTLGVTFSYGVEASLGSKPASFTQLERVASIGGIQISPNTIDSSTLEDLVERMIAGRASTGGTFDVVINLTDETEAQISAMISAYEEGSKTGKRVWFQTQSPYLTKAFFVVAQPPLIIPQPETSGNSVWQVTLPLTIEEFKGLDTKVALATE